MRKIIVLSVLILSFNCREKSKNDNVIKGDIFIKLIDFGSLYGASDQEISDFKKSLVLSEQTDNENEKAVQEYFKTLLKYDLLDKPYFKLKINENEIINVYTNESEFNKIKKYIDDFNKDTEKIEVAFSGSKKERNIYVANNIISVEKKWGKTDWAK